MLYEHSCLMNRFFPAPLILFVPSHLFVPAPFPQSMKTLVLLSHFRRTQNPHRLHIPVYKKHVYPVIKKLHDLTARVRNKYKKKGKPAAQQRGFVLILSVMRKSAGKLCIRSSHSSSRRDVAKYMAILHVPRNYHFC